LAAFIGWLAGRQDHASELVLNGDTFDFLAEKVFKKQPFWTAFRLAQKDAVDCLETIVQRRCPIVFDALREYLRKGHRVVILPGNHDIEA